jgi:hypothetical protein
MGTERPRPRGPAGRPGSAVGVDGKVSRTLPRGSGGPVLRETSLVECQQKSSIEGLFRSLEGVPLSRRVGRLASAPQSAFDSR